MPTDKSIELNLFHFDIQYGASRIEVVTYWYPGDRFCLCGSLYAYYDSNGRERA
jgi:hypothetical protein